MQPCSGNICVGQLTEHQSPRLPLYPLRTSTTPACSRTPGRPATPLSKRCGMAHRSTQPVCITPYMQHLT
eukprot:354243-Chlamydomonas_euryale.AAC.4